MNKRKAKVIIPLYIVSLGDIHCNELRFIVEKFLDQNPEYKEEVNKLKELNNK